MIGQDIDAEIKALSRRVAADGRRTEYDADEACVGVLKQKRLAHSFVFVIKRERNKRVFLGHVRLVRDAVHRAWRRKEKTPDAGLFGGDHHGLETVKSYRCCKVLVQLETRRVRNTCETDEAVMPGHCAGQLCRIANVALDYLQVGIALGQKTVSVITDVVARYLVAAPKQPRYEYRSDVTGAPGYEHT